MIVVYDGECRICSALVRWLEKRLGARLEALPYQMPGVLERLGLERQEAETAVWTVAPDGRRAKGAEAINRLLHEAGGLWRWVARLYRLPGVGFLEEAGYGWFTRHRHLFGHFFGAPTCAEPAAGCGP